MSIRKNLEYLRKQKNLSQEELAYKLGVSRQAVSKWETGAAYPETEKMLAICKIFNCSLDDLMREDIQQLELEKDRKYTLNDLINEITGIITRTLDMFDNMTFKSMLRFGFEIFMLFLIILLLHIPFSYLFNLGNNVLINIGGDISNLLISIWRLITEVVYIVIAIVSFGYIYKIRFLDKFESVKKEDSKIDRKEDSVTKDKEEKKVEIRKYDFGVFSFIGKVALFFIKCFTAFISLPIIFLLFASVASVLIGIVLMFNGVVFIGVIIFLLSLIVFTISLLNILYNFIVNHRSNWQKLFIFFVACVVGFGVGAGISVLEFSKMTISNEAPVHVETSVKRETFKMKENTVVLSNLVYDYVVDESLGDSIQLEVVYYDVFTDDVVIEEIEDTGNIYIQTKMRQSINLGELYNILIKDLKDKRLSNYTALGQYKFKVYGSEENINKLEENLEKMFNMDYQEDTDCECLE